MNSAVMFWSSGKDSAAALQEVTDRLKIERLVTTVNRPDRHVAVHRVPEALLERQAAAMKLPLEKIVLPSPCSNDEYERLVLQVLESHRECGIDTVVFGDINLADIRAYREDLLSRANMQGLFPLWGRDTRELSRHLIDSGIRAVVTCVDNNVLSREHAGADYDDSFIRSLPDYVDPCGENGEFHTFVYDAGMFSQPVPVEVHESMVEGAFSYAIIGERTQEQLHGG